MRVLGVDHGKRRIGLAVSDESGLLARPLLVLPHVARAADAQRVAEIAAEHGAGLIVVGLPTDADGQIGPQARRAMRFGEALRAVADLPVQYWDESYSTADAKAALRAAGGRRKHRTPVDAAAAAVILQDYLSAQRPHASTLSG